MNHVEAPLRAALTSFGIPEAILEPFTGGLMNHVYRVETASTVLVLKDYNADALNYLDPQQVCDAQELARAQGLPVPALSRTTDGRSFASASDRTFTLAEFIEGRTYGVDEMSDRAAHSAGVALARLQEVLAALPAGEAPALWSLDRIRAHLHQLLAFADARRRTNAVDERAASLIRQKLDLLEGLTETPAYEPGWTHGDYHWRNILFNGDDEVVGIIDFDTVAYFSPARDVMRCVALSFPSLGDAAFAFLAGYANTKHLSPDEARQHVEFYRYISSYRVWPAAQRYLEPETYDPRWDDLIQPFPEWDWQMLSDRFAVIAAPAGEPRL